MWLPYTLFIVIAAAIVLESKAILGTIYEGVLLYDLQHGDVPAEFGQLGSAASPGNAWSLSILNQGYLFFRYLLIWLFPNPDWMSVNCGWF